MFKSEKETIVVGGPKNFRHASHIGWGADGFSITDLPDEWKRLFKKAGVRKSELKDQETAQYILGVISDAMNSQGMLAAEVGIGEKDKGSGGENMESNGTNPPPPPPNVKAPPPPPPPPGMGGPPPPPSSNPNINHSSGGGSSLLEELQQKKSGLSSNSNGPIPEIKNLTANQENNLVDTLASAMKNIRQDVGGSDDEGDNGGWSEDSE